MKRESEFAKAIRKKLAECQAELLPVVGNRMQPAAWPDLYVAHPIYHGWIEFKGEETVLEKDQQIRITRLKRKGIPAFIVRYPNKIEDEYGELLAEFDAGKGIDLLVILSNLWEEFNND